MRPSGRTFAIVLAALAAALALGLWLAGAGDEETDPGTEPADRTPIAAAAGSDPAAAARAEGRDHRLDVDAPEGAHSVIWVLPGERVPVRDRPDRSADVVEVARPRTEFGSPTVFGVLRTRGEWAGVSTAALPNDELGWVRLDARRLGASWTEQRIDVSLSERRAVLSEAGRELRSFTVTIGAAGSPTPTGWYSVTDTFRGDLNPVYGCCAVAISAIQPDVPSGWLGGDRIAFHGNGTGEPLGVAASNGCLRAADEDVSALVDRVGLGTPVFVRD